MARHLEQGLAVFLSSCLLSCLLTFGAEGAFADQAGTSGSQPPPQTALQSAEQLQQLVAPIALYPDALIAQILPAATYPEQVVDAERWVAQHKDLTGENLATAVDGQSWDASIKALAQFPAVLANMNQNLAWASELGDAYVNQQQDLSQAIQTMRASARQAGNLNTTHQEKVTTNGQTIVIQPAQSDVVYVPQYDPWLVYGAPLAMFPGWYPWPGLFLDGPGIGFGLGFDTGFFGGFGWGWPRWGFDWHRGGRVVYNHNTYVSRSTTIVNRNSFNSGRTNFGNRPGSRGFGRSQAPAGMHSGAFSGFTNGGIARGNAFRGQSSVGGFHGDGSGGGFHGGGFHGGGGRR
jgi:hypothetical protein